MSAFDEPEVCRNILESLPAGMCVVDVQKRIVFWSDGAERLTGHLRHEVIGHSCVSEPVLHCDQPGCEFCREDCPVARAIKTSRAVAASGFLHHKEGHEVPVAIRAVAVRNQHGSVIGAVETFESVELPALGTPHHSGAHLAGFNDEVTGAASRARMQFHLREALAMFSDAESAFGVLLIRLEGLDHFRAAFGMEAAASLLRGAARTLETAMGHTDLVGRWSHDQFLVLLHACPEDAIGSVRERARRMLANHSIEWWGERHSLPATIGQAAVTDGDSMESIIERVTQSLEQASGGQSRPTASAANPSSGS